MNNSKLVGVALTLADSPTQPMTEKEIDQKKCLRKMLSELRHRDEFTDTQDFYEVLTILKQKDAKLEAQGLTESHPDRYNALSLISEAEALR